MRATAAPQDSVEAPATGPYRLTGTELVFGWVVEKPVPPVRIIGASTGNPLEVLEDVLRPALARQPCLVEFSGGRDSSLVLAAAVSVARKEGLPLPVPVTQRFPGLEEADEDGWQEAVVRHLGLHEWERSSYGSELDLLGPLARSVIRRYGVLWPALAYLRLPRIEHAAGGSLVSGEGGDEVFGARRFSPVRQVLSGSVPVNRRAAKHVGLSLAPKALRRLGYRRLLSRMETPWLVPSARAQLMKALADDAACEPLDWRQSLRRHLRRRSVVEGLRTLDFLAEEGGVLSLHPLLDPRFVDSVCRAGGVTGFVNRTDAMRKMFGALLPDNVLARSGKARFNRAAFNEHSRRFVESWSGEGITSNMVDVEGLGSVWRSAEPHAMTFPLLQHCWLAAEGSPGDG
jgi:asparagine synthase (glutamine-hydrolysing)